VLGSSLRPSGAASRYPKSPMRAMSAAGLPSGAGAMLTAGSRLTLWRHVIQSCLVFRGSREDHSSLVSARPSLTVIEFGEAVNSLAIRRQAGSYRTKERHLPATSAAIRCHPLGVSQGVITLPTCPP